jgi:hypothetical protein
MTLIMKPYFVIGILSTYLFACCSSDSVNETIPPTPPSEKVPINIRAQWKFSGDKHKSLQVETERTFHQQYPLVML